MYLLDRRRTDHGASCPTMVPPALGLVPASEGKSARGLGRRAGQPGAHEISQGLGQRQIALSILYKAALRAQ